jgi:hypothetical protein
MIPLRPPPLQQITDPASGGYDGVVERTDAPLPGETKVAIGALGLLFLQSLRESFLFTFGPHADRDGPLSIMIIIVFFALIKGLWDRIPLAWWLTLILVGAAGVLHAVVFGPVLRESLRALGSPLPPELTYHDIVDLRSRPILRGADLFWILSRGVLLGIVPVVLLMGKLRERLRRPQSETKGLSARS